MFLYTPFRPFGLVVMPPQTFPRRNVFGKIPSIHYVFTHWFRCRTTKRELTMKSFFSFFFLGALVLGSLFVLPMMGRNWIGPGILFAEAGENGNALLLQEQRIYWEMRFPRTVLAMLTGSGLALAGMVFQALFRNPLATPYTLGIASGASFGASVFLLYSPWVPALFFGMGQSIYALGGALLATWIVYLLSRSKDVSSERMLLAGVAVNFFFASLVLFLQYLADPAQTFRMLRYTMGGFEGTDMGGGTIQRLGLIVLISCGLLFFLSRELNVIVTGNDRATALGIDVQRFRTVLFVLTSLLVGMIVAVSGPIGFVGLMVPHLCRLLIGPDHRRLVPATILFGAFFLAACDTLARSVLTVGVLPTGIVTSLLGGPFFLWLLIRSERAPGV